jgi:hypothetical protein
MSDPIKSFKDTCAQYPNLRTPEAQSKVGSSLRAVVTTMQALYNDDPGKATILSRHLLQALGGEKAAQGIGNALGLGEQKIMGNLIKLGTFATARDELATIHKKYQDFNSNKSDPTMRSNFAEAIKRASKLIQETAGEESQFAKDLSAYVIKNLGGETGAQAIAKAVPEVHTQIDILLKISQAAVSAPERTEERGDKTEAPAKRSIGTCAWVMEKVFGKKYHKE